MLAVILHLQWKLRRRLRGLENSIGLGTYLLPTVAGHGVVPQVLVRTLNGHLVMVAMGKDRRSEGDDGERFHGGGQLPMVQFKRNIRRREKKVNWYPSRVSRGPWEREEDSFDRQHSLAVVIFAS